MTVRLCDRAHVGCSPLRIMISKLKWRHFARASGISEEEPMCWEMQLMACSGMCMSPRILGCQQNTLLCTVWRFA